MKELIGNLKEKLQLHITYQVYIELAKNSLFASISKHKFTSFIHGTYFADLAACRISNLKTHH